MKRCTVSVSQTALLLMAKKVLLVQQSSNCYSVYEPNVIMNIPYVETVLTAVSRHEKSPFKITESQVSGAPYQANQ